MIAEEDSQFLRETSSTEYCNHVLSYVNEILYPNQGTLSSVFLLVTLEDVLNALDSCHYDGDISKDYWVHSVLSLQ